MFHPLCGYSLQKGTKFISIADLVICILSLTFRLVAYDYYEYEEYEIETEFYPTNGTMEEYNGNMTHSLQDSEYNAVAANVTAHLLEILKQGSRDIASENNEHFWVMMIVKMIIAVIMYVTYICLEVWLCRLLMRASNNRDGAACKTWFWFRLLITIFILIYSIVGILTLKHDWVDFTLEPLNLYRIYELFVVNEFRKEITATSGRVKLRP